MDYRSDPLWQRIEAFTFDDRDAAYPFSKKLATEQKWTAAFTTRAIDEYRRYIYLCCISPNGASPSKVVDEVWHLHLTYTLNYWKKFCGETLNKEIHHHPSAGGQEQKMKHDDWYEQTVQLYTTTFGQDPPADIWTAVPGTIMPTAGTDVPRDFFFEKGTQLRYLLLVLPFVFIYFRYGQWNPFGLSGAHFLFFYFWLVLFSFIITIISLNAKRRLLLGKLDAMLPSIGKFDPAFLADEQSNRFQLLVNSLASENIIAPVTGNDINELYEYYTIDRAALRASSNPLAAALDRHIGDTISQSDLVRCSGLIFDQLIGKFSAMRRVFDHWSNNVLLPLIVLAVGIGRCIQGAYNERPISYLVVMLVACTIGCLVVFSGNNFNYTCLAYFTKITRTNSQLDSDARLGFLSLGAAGIPVIWFFDKMHEMQMNRRTDGSCGGSSCGGSGGCGGGCGGCGGS